VPFALVSAAHIVALSIPADAFAGATKLWLMPLLVLAVFWGGRGSGWGTTYTLLFLALAFSWIGDGAATFVPQLPELPTMLLSFGLAHLCYIALFWRFLAVRRIPAWAAVYALWWVVLLAVLWPTIGALLIAVALYGVVLGGTAVAASRCHPLVAIGAAVFLVSDTVLAFLLFTPSLMPAWTDPLVMLTYCTGQGLIAAGVIIALHERATTRARAAA
jgi:uncharacterized membrane protein YhhN